jgi:hypothetical protein
MMLVEGKRAKSEFFANITDRQGSVASTLKTRREEKEKRGRKA